MALSKGSACSRGDIEPLLSEGVVAIERPPCFFPDEDVGDAAAEPDALHERADFVRSLMGLFVVADRGDENRREVPLLGEGGADLSVVGAQACLFHFEQLLMVEACVAEDGFVVRAQRLRHGQHAEVLEQSAEEGFLGLDHAEFLGEIARRRGGVEAPLPEREQVEGLLAAVREVGHEAEAEREGLDAVEPEHDQGVADGADGVGLAVKAGIDGLEDLGGQRRVVLDRVGDVLDVHVVLLNEIDHFHRDRRQARQPR